MISCHAFPPELAQYGATLHPPRPDAVPLAALLHPDALAALVDAYAATLASTDRRAVLSMWTQHYLLALLPPLVAMALVADRQPDPALHKAGVVLAPDRRPLAVCLPDGPRDARDGCPAERLTPLLRGHLEPLAGRLTAAGLPPAVTWSNAGHVVAWSLRTILAPPARLARLRETLGDPSWIDGGPNPLHPALHQGPHPATRAVCCLRHRLAAATRCDDCPLVRSRAGARLRAAQCVPNQCPAA